MNQRERWRVVRMDTRRWAAPLALLLGGGLVATAFGAEVEPIGRAIPSEGWVPNPYVTQHDNPRVYGHVQLDADESVERFKVGPMTGATNGSHRVRLRTICSPTDLFCVDDLLWSAWPRDPDAGYLTNGEFEYEAFGPRIGHQWATLEFVKENEQYVQSVADSINVRLDPETIVVPLHVLVEVPRDRVNADGVPDMEVFTNVREYVAFIDDDFSDPDSVVDVSAPGVGLDVNRIFMSQNPDLQGETMKIGSISEVRPDDVYDACGIQFRLMGVTALYDDTSALDESKDDTGATDGNGALQWLSKRMLGVDPNDPEHLTDEVRLLWGTTPRPQDLVLAFVPHVGDITALEPRGRQYSNVAAVGVYAYRAGAVVVAAHELGHALGLDGTDDGHPTCPSYTPDDDQLMCNLNGQFTDIPGCSHWRSGIERMRGEPEICLEEPCPERQPDVPVGCNMDEETGDQVRTLHLDMCLTARKAAASMSAEFSGNKPPQLSIDDAAGNVLVSLQGGLAASEDLTVECGGTLDLRRTLIHDPSDPFPQYAPRLSGWKVTYDDVLSNEVETIDYDGNTSQITVDLDRHPGWSLRVSFGAYDAQSAYASAGLSISRPADTEAPVLAALPEVLLDGCVSNEPRTLPWPEASAADNCGGTTIISGQVVSLNGAELATPIEVTTEGTVFDAAGRYDSNGLRLMPRGTPHRQCYKVCFPMRV